jgi:predicted transposase/invertase (TIGR01784 family)
MKTDPIFYRLFKTFPSVFFELIGQAPAAAAAYEFRSVEIKQTAFRIDGVFIPTPSTPQQPILFVEVQFQKDNDFYFRLFSEITLYLRQYKPVGNWQAIVIYPSRSVESSEPLAYQDWLALPKVQRLYLDELASSLQEGYANAPEPSLGISLVQLVVEVEERTPEQARELIAKAQQEVGDRYVQREIIELIETIVVYKFPQKSRQELEAMLGLGDLKQTKFYQEAAQETKLEAVPRLLKLGLSVEQIAEALELPVEEVRKAVQQE